MEMNEELLAFYMGCAFSHALQVQQLLAPGELMVPFVAYWNGDQPTFVPYPAASQEEAVANSVAAREQQKAVTEGWVGGREGLVTQNDGTKLDVLLLEGWVRNLELPLEMFIYCRKAPFRLIKGFIWKSHPHARKDTHAFMASFKRGISSHSFGAQCLDIVEHAEPINVGD
jgi:hypothetical protein